MLSVSFTFMCVEGFIFCLEAVKRWSIMVNRAVLWTASVDDREGNSFCSMFEFNCYFASYSLLLFIVERSISISVGLFATLFSV